MKIIYLNEYHPINTSILNEAPSLVKVGVVGMTDLMRFRMIYPQSKIIIYEADSHNYGAFVKYDSDGIVDSAYRKAVGKDGTVNMYRFTNNVSNSTYPRHLKDPNCKYVSEEKVKSISIEGVLDENHLDYLDILILNCEGGEVPVMKDMANEKIRNRIGQICVSFHDPRIYPTKVKTEIFNEIGQYYHITRADSYKGAIPDYLLIRRV